MIPVAEAKRLTLAHVPVLPVETIPLPEALGRVLAADVQAPIDLPPFDNSAMDGFALHVGDVAAASAAVPVRLPIAFEVPAGKAPAGPLPQGQAARIMTGAVMPAGADGVIMIEDVDLDGDHVIIRQPVSPGEFVRPAGGDVAAGAVVMAAGTEITPARLGLLAALGLPRIDVHRRPRVAILATGDELVDLGEPLAPGEIYNSNAYAMAAMVRAFGGEPVPMGIIPDERQATRRLIERALDCDLVLTSGGVSMGEYDYVGATLAELGTIHFTRVAQQPGKPLTFATVRGTPVFGLPGNPVSTMVTLEVYVRPVLRRMLGHAVLERPRLQARLAEPLRKAPGKQLFLRARLALGPDGVIAHLTGPQASNVITSMAWANALLLVPAESGDLPEGARVEALVLDAAGLAATASGTGMMAVEAAQGQPCC